MFKWIITIALMTAVAAPAPAGAAPTVGGCSVLPPEHAFNRDISRAPVHPMSDRWTGFIAGDLGGGNLHPDFGSNPEYGIPFSIVKKNQRRVPIKYVAYGDESDKGPFPIPRTARVEGGSRSDGDRHVIVLQRSTCRLYELYRAFKSGRGWKADSGAKFDLRRPRLRPEGWTSADAAGLPILPGLVRYDEVRAGRVEHAIRFTVETVRKAWMHPATHYGTTEDTDAPPYGARFRLKASFDTSRLSGQARPIAEAMKRYGLILADQGSNWYFTGASDRRWNDDQLNQLKEIPGSAFEAVDLGERIRTP